MNIYVANLADEVIEKDIQKRFVKFGDVESVKIVKDMISGASTGYAYVDMPDLEEAKNAISKLNGRKLKKRKIKVSVFDPAVDRRGGRAMGNVGAGGLRKW